MGEDILTPVRDKTTKILFALAAVAGFLAVFFFIALQNARSKGGTLTIPLWGGIICTALALILGIIAFVRFLRRRSISTGLFITTTVATLVYSIVARVLRVRGTNGTTYSPVNTLSAATTGTNGNSFFTVTTLMQIGLFAVWFLFLLFTIYIYIRPIRRIDELLTQILEGNEVKKIRVGESVQYKSIEDKLKVLADEKYRRDIKRADRLNKTRERNARQRELIQELLDEKAKLSPAPEVKPE